MQKGREQAKPLSPALSALLCEKETMGIFNPFQETKNRFCRTSYAKLSHTCATKNWYTNPPGASPPHRIFVFHFSDDRKIKICYAIY